MRFKIYGPFKLPLDKITHLIPPKSKEHRPFWNESVETKISKLSTACGVYVFAMRSGGGVKIWYVGQTNKQGFRYECLNSGKINLFNSIIAKPKTGTPILYLIARLTNKKNRFVRPSARKRRDIDFLEDYLIGAALQRNRDLLNRKGTKMFSEIEVDGLLNASPGPPGKAASELSRALML